MTEETRVEMERLLGIIQEMFYREMDPKRFYQDRTMLQKAITWPATWLRSRGITWTSERYFRELRDRLGEIKQHGATGEFRAFPGYLMKCLQTHFAHCSDSYCDEGRRVRNAVDLAMASVRFSDAPRRDENLVDVLAAAHAVLANRKRTAKPVSSDDDQPTLF